MRSYLPPLTATLLAFLVALVVVLWRQHESITTLRATIAAAEAALQAQHQATARLQQMHEQQLRHDERRMAELTTELELARAAAERTGEDADRLRTDPAYVELRQREQRRYVQERYGDLFVRLALPADQLESFKQLLIELGTRGRAVAPAAPGDIVAPARTRADIEGDIRTLLDDANYAAFQNFGYELAQVRPQVNRFASDAADAGVPLSNVQRAALARAIAEATDPRQTTAGDGDASQTSDAESGLSPLDQRVLAVATDVLSPAQLELFRTFRREERASLDAWRRVVAPPGANATASP